MRYKQPPLFPNSVRMLLLLLVLGLSSCSENKKLFYKIDKQLETGMEFRSGFTGLAVYDPEAEKFLYQYQSNKYFTPASTIKLLTFYTGLKLLGDSIPGIRYTVRRDSLIFQGTGDPSLLHPTLPKSDLLEFLKDPEHKLYYLPAKNPVTPLGSGWAWDDYPYPFSTERAVLPIYGNVVRFRFSPFHSAWIIPKHFNTSVTPGVISKGSVTRAVHENEFHLPLQPKKESQEIPFRTSEKLAVKLLADTLGRAITVLSNNSRIGLTQRINSIATDSLYKTMLQESDNFIAEQILLMAAGIHTDTMETERAIAIMKEKHLKDLPDPVKWVDGSGLSRYNLLTPRTVIKILDKLSNEVPYSTLFEFLPAGGISGTLKDQFSSERPFVFAKTGSMSNQYSLSGYLVTAKGKILLFSFMNSNYMGSPTLLKQHVANILTSISNQY